MRIFRNKPFTRFAKNAALDDDAVCEAVDDAERGLINARLGGGVIKQRLARRGEGKSGGFRAVILYKPRTLAFFVFGYAKKEKSNIDRAELAAFKVLASEMLSLNDAQIAQAIEAGTLIEVVRSEEDKTIS